MNLSFFTYPISLSCQIHVSGKKVRIVSTGGGGGGGGDRLSATESGDPISLEYATPPLEKYTIKKQHLMSNSSPDKTDYSNLIIKKLIL